MATYERLDYGSPDGSQWGGASTDQIGFFGTTPTSYQAVTNLTSVTQITSAAGASVVSSLVVALKLYGLV